LVDNKLLRDGGKGRRPDGRWYVYYQYRDTSNYRNIGAYLSDTTDLSGDWTDLGVLIADNGANEQRYGIKVFWYDGKCYGSLLNYDASTELTKIGLWDSEDGQSWRCLYDWITHGSEGEWDEGILWQGKFVDLGNNWRYYYSGGQEDHATHPQRKVAVGYVHNATATPSYLTAINGSAIMTHDGKFIYIG